jgi:signal transduction histidine kinase
MAATKRCNRTHESELHFLEDLRKVLGRAVRVGSRSSALRRVLDMAMRSVGGTRGFLALVNRDTAELRVEYIAGNGWSARNKRLRLHLAQETNRGITGHVALTGKPYVTGDAPNDPHYLCFFDDVRSELAVPILSPTGKTAGVLNIESTVPNAFDAIDEARLEVVAHAAATALGLEGFRLREQALVEIGSSLTTTIDADDMLSKVVSEAAEVLQYEDCSVLMLDETAEQLVLRAARRPRPDALGHPVCRAGQGLSGWVVTRGEPVRLKDPLVDARYDATCPELPSDDVGPFLAVPVPGRDATLGVLTAARRRSASRWFSNEFSEADQRVLSTIAGQLGAALEHADSMRKLLHAGRMAAWGELSAKSAHMIGNRTFALKGDVNELSYVIASLPESDEKRELLAITAGMGTGISQLEEILRECRDFVMATKLRLAEAVVQDLLRDALDEAFPKRSPIALELAVAPEPSAVMCDAEKLKRAFSEIVENAVSFQPDGGSLRIGLGVVAAGERPDVRLAPSRRYVEIAFADGGPGVPTDIKSTIFRPFYSTRTKGMGLGLSIVKGIVEAHEGRIVEDGVPGEGARFRIYLPALREASKKRSQRARGDRIT